MSITYLFGFAHDDLEGAAVAVQNALRIQLHSRNSDYIGEYCRATLASGESLRLQRNLDPLFDAANDPAHERFAEPDFPCALLLLRVSDVVTSSLRQTLEGIPGISLLAEREVA